MAGVMSQELGKPVDYVDLAVEAWGEVLSKVEGMTDSLVVHLKAVAVDHQNGSSWPCSRPAATLKP